MKLKVSVRQLIEAVANHLGAKAEASGLDGKSPAGAEVEFETDDITKVLRFIRKAEKE